MLFNQTKIIIFNKNLNIRGDIFSRRLLPDTGVALKLRKQILDMRKHPVKNLIRKNQIVASAKCFYFYY